MGHLPAGKMDEGQRARVQGAVTILMGVTHESVARCLGTWMEADGRLCSVEEYGIRGDLFTEMYSERWALCTCGQGSGGPHLRGWEVRTEMWPAPAWPHSGGSGLGWAGQPTSGAPRGVFWEGTPDCKVCCEGWTAGREVAVVLVWGVMGCAVRGEAAAIVALLAAGASHKASPCCRGRLTERFVACKVVAPLLQGLRALHSQRIIHRSVLLYM